MASRKSKSAVDSVRVHGLRGRVAEGPFARGSKSEHIAVFLETGPTRYLLRRRNGPSYSDAALQQLVGCEVECDGIVVSYVLIADRIERV